MAVVVVIVIIIIIVSFHFVITLVTAADALSRKIALHHKTTRCSTFHKNVAEMTKVVETV